MIPISEIWLHYTEYSCSYQQYKGNRGNLC